MSIFESLLDLAPASALESVRQEMQRLHESATTPWDVHDQLRTPGLDAAIKAQREVDAMQPVLERATREVQASLDAQDVLGRQAQIMEDALRQLELNEQIYRQLRWPFEFLQMEEEDWREQRRQLQHERNKKIRALYRDLARKGVLIVDAAISRVQFRQREHDSDLPLAGIRLWSSSLRAFYLAILDRFRTKVRLLIRSNSPFLCWRSCPEAYLTIKPIPSC